MRCGRRAALWAVLVGSCVAVLPVTGAAAAGEGARPRTERISVTADGSQANDYSDVGGISANGRYVAFDSTSTAIVANDTNASADVFVRDLTTNSTVRVSINDKGTQASGAPETGLLLRADDPAATEVRIALRPGVFAPGVNLESRVDGRQHVYMPARPGERGEDYEIGRFREMVRDE